MAHQLEHSQTASKPSEGFINNEVRVVCLPCAVDGKYHTQSLSQNWLHLTDSRA